MAKELCPSHPCIVEFGLVGPISRGTAVILEWLLTYAQDAGAVAVVLSINSPGGILQAAEHMVYAIRYAGIPVYCVVDKLAASGAAWVLEACHERAAVPTSYIMFHHPFFMLPGMMKLTKDDLQEALDFIEKTTVSMHSPIAERMGWPIDKFLAKLDEGDWRIQADEALSINLLDILVPSVQDYIVQKINQWKR